MKKQKDYDGKFIKHANNVLKEINNHFDFKNGCIHVLDQDYNLLLLELSRTYNLPVNILEHITLELKRTNTGFTHTGFTKTYSDFLNTKIERQEEYKFYFPLNHTNLIELELNSFKIKMLSPDQKKIVSKQLKTIIKTGGFNRKIDLTRTEIYEFETKSNDYYNVREKFYLTFQLYKGILEYSYHRFKWNYYYTLGVDIPNKKVFSCFKYPRFILSRLEGGFNDIIEHEDYQYNYMELKKNNEDVGNRKFFEETIKVFTKNKINKDILDLLSDCFRLYGNGIDNPYIDQSFLFFWNVLERISLSETGNTDKIVRRIQCFFSKKFWEHNANSINHLKNIRNKRVHKGVGDVGILDLYLLKYMCDVSILFILGNPPGSESHIKTTKHLEVFYSLKENQNSLDIEEIKEMTEFIISKKIV